MAQHARGRLLDAVLVVGVACAAAGGLVGVIVLMVDYHIRVIWFVLAFLAVMLAVIEGRAMRPRFRQPLFIPFFALGLAGQVAVVSGAEWEWGLAGMLPALALGLFAFGLLTYLLFGPANAKRHRDTTAGSETRPDAR